MNLRATGVAELVMDRMEGRGSTWQLDFGIGKLTMA